MARVMVLGSGGREHALAKWFDMHDHAVYVAPGNGGTALDRINIDLDPNDFDAVRHAAVKNNIRLVVPGPDALVVNGIVDYWWENDLPTKHGIQIFGPSKEGAELEGSKCKGMRFARRYGVPTPLFMPFDSGQYDQNMKDFANWSRRRKGIAPFLVVKADGLCAGKGVTICDTEKEVKAAADKLPGFGSSGENFILEERLVGEEASITVITDGKGYRMFHHSQDHKRRRDGDHGPNTGGMGAYAPTKIVTKDLEARIEREIVRPLIRGMKHEHIDYRGILYLAIMVQKGKPYLLEINSRFGDPETQAIVPLIDADPYETMIDCCEGRLGAHKFRRKRGYSCAVILVHEEYPEKSSYGRRIHFDPLLEFMRDVMVFHAGTRESEGKIYTDGGRILAVTGISRREHAEAIGLAYRAAEKISFKGMDYRRDIGRSVI